MRLILLLFFCILQVYNIDKFIHLQEESVIVVIPAFDAEEMLIVVISNDAEYLNIQITEISENSYYIVIRMLTVFMLC